MKGEGEIFIIVILDGPDRVVERASHYCCILQQHVFITNFTYDAPPRGCPIVVCSCVHEKPVWGPED